MHVMGLSGAYVDGTNPWQAMEDLRAWVLWTRRSVFPRTRTCAAWLSKMRSMESWTDHTGLQPKHQAQKSSHERMAFETKTPGIISMCHVNKDIAGFCELVYSLGWGCCPLYKDDSDTYLYGHRIPLPCFIHSLGLGCSYFPGHRIPYDCRTNP